MKTQGSQKQIFKKQMKKKHPLDFVAAVESKVINSVVVAHSEAHRG